MTSYTVEISSKLKASAGTEPARACSAGCTFFIADLIRS